MSDGFRESIFTAKHCQILWVIGFPRLCVCGITPLGIKYNDEEIILTSEGIEWNHIFSANEVTRKLFYSKNQGIFYLVNYVSLKKNV